MKKFSASTGSATAALLIATLVVVLLSAYQAFAAQPTVTITKIEPSANPNVVIYKYTWSTDITAVDSVLFTDENGNAINIGQMVLPQFTTGYGRFTGQVDSCVALHIETTEATVDSIRFDVIHQVSYASSPNDYVTEDWYTFKSTDCDSVARLFEMVNVRRLTVPNYYRPLWYESDSNKDAEQNFTAYLVIPKRRR